MIRMVRALALATAATSAACSGGAGTTSNPAAPPTSTPQGSAHGTLTIRDSVLTATEFLSYGAHLAVDSVNLSAVAPGSTVPVTVTMTMIPVGVAVTTDPLNGSDATTLSSNAATPTVWNSCPAILGPSYLVPYDAANSFVLFGQNVGVNGIPPALIGSQASDNSGTSHISTDIADGVHFLVRHGARRRDRHDRRLRPDQHQRTRHELHLLQVRVLLTTARTRRLQRFSRRLRADGDGSRLRRRRGLRALR